MSDLIKALRKAVEYLEVMDGDFRPHVPQPLWEKVITVVEHVAHIKDHEESCWIIQSPYEVPESGCDCVLMPLEQLRLAVGEK